MHRRAEYGIAAHWGYKEGGRRGPRAATAPGPTPAARRRPGPRRARTPRPRPSKKASGMTPAQRAEMVERDRRAERLALAKETSSTTAEIEWMQRIVDFQNETTDPIEFLEALKLDLEEDEVYVFTPKGKVIALAANATPVDFAYSIHTEVGHKCIGAKVNGRLVPLDTRLNSADTVEIFTSKAETAGPSRDWLHMVASSRARSKIRQWFSRERREDAIELGPRRADQGAPTRGAARPEAGLGPHPDHAGRVDELRRRRRPARGHRRQPDQRPGRHPADPARPAGRDLRGAAPGHRPPAADRRPPGQGLLGRGLRRGPRRHDGPAVAVLHPGARATRSSAS